MVRPLLAKVCGYVIYDLDCVGKRINAKRVPEDSKGAGENLAGRRRVYVQCLNPAPAFCVAFCHFWVYKLIRIAILGTSQSLNLAPQVYGVSEMELWRKMGVCETGVGF